MIFRMSKVTVIVPSFNHARFIEGTVASILQQTHRDLELIVVDDCSSDDSVTLLRQFTGDPRFTLVPLSSNVGAGAAMNIGAERATGEFIAFCGSDDQFLSDKLEKQLAVFDNQSDLGVVFTHIELIDENGRTYPDGSHPLHPIFKQANRSRGQWIHRFFYDGNCLCQPSALIRRDLFEAVGRQDARLTQLHDFALWIRCVQRNPIHIIEAPLTRYRRSRHAVSLSDHGLASNLRVRWESIAVLSLFLETSDTLAVDAFGAQYLTDRASLGATTEQAIALAATRQPHRWHQFFGIQTLYESLRGMNRDAPSPQDTQMLAKLREISGQLDPMGLAASLAPPPAAPRVTFNWNSNAGAPRTTWR